MLATVCELDSRADDEVLDGPRDQDLSGGGQGSHPGRDVDGQSSEVVTADFAFAGVEPGSRYNQKLWIAGLFEGAAYLPP